MIIMLGSFFAKAIIQNIPHIDGPEDFSLKSPVCDPGNA